MDLSGTNNKCLNNGIFLIGVLPSSICFVIVVWISIHSWRKLKHAPKVNAIIKYLHYVLCILAIIIIATRVIASYFCTNNERITAPIGIGSYYIGGLCILATIFMRIYSTFKKSVYKTSKYQNIFLIILLFINIINFFATSILFEVFGITMTVGIILVYSGIIYCISSVYGMSVFSKKMYQLTKNEASDDTQIELNRQQLNLMNITSKYISLLSLAVITTWFALGIQLISYLYIISIDEYEGIGRCIFSVTVAVDSTVNLICLFLQYPFSKHYYDKYCKGLAKCCASMLITKTTRAMKFEHTEKDQVNLDVPNWDNVAANSNDIDEETESKLDNISVMSDGHHKDKVSESIGPTLDRYESTAL